MDNSNSNITTLINQAESLPADQRAIIVDALSRTLNPSQTEIETAWTQVAQRRLDEINAGTAELMSTDQVFKEIDDLLS